MRITICGPFSDGNRIDYPAKHRAWSARNPIFKGLDSVKSWEWEPTASRIGESLTVFVKWDSRSHGIGRQEVLEPAIICGQLNHRHRLFQPVPIPRGRDAGIAQGNQGLIVQRCPEIPRPRIRDPEGTPTAKSIRASATSAECGGRAFLWRGHPSRQTAVPGQADGGACHRSQDRTLAHAFQAEGRRENNRRSGDGRDRHGRPGIAGARVSRKSRIR
jgi:hypothetical protein